MGSSFAPKDFAESRGPKWTGGPATLTDPIFKYRTFVPLSGDNAGQEVKLATLHATYLDPEGNSNPGRYDVGNAQYCQIKEGPEKGADAAEEGPSIAHPNPDLEYRIGPNSDFGKFLSSLVSAGYPESKLLDGDITVLDGLEVEVYEQPRKDGDKFPLRLIKSVTLKGGAKRAAPAAAKNDATDEITAKGILVVRGALADSGGEPVAQANLVKRAMAALKGDPAKAEVIRWLGQAANLSSIDGAFYDETDKTIQAV